MEEESEGIVNESEVKVTSEPVGCEVCGYSNVELFGYRRHGGWRWFCAAHRIGQFYADKRIPAPDDGGGYE